MAPIDNRGHFYATAILRREIFYLGILKMQRWAMRTAHPGTLPGARRLSAGTLVAMLRLSHK